MNRQSELYQVFENENLILARAKEVMAQADPNKNADQVCAEYGLLTKSYAQLLGDVKLLTSVSDRLQAKINKASQQTSRKDGELALALAQLENERAGRRAFMLVMGLATLFFVISEWVIDPQLQRHTEILGGHAAVVLKSVVALALYPISQALKNNLRKMSVKK